MKPIRNLLSGVFIISGLIGLLNSLHAQEVVPDSIVQVAAEAQGLGLVSVSDLPDVGTFWLVMSNGIVPDPAPLFDPSLPVYQIADGEYLVDATAGQVMIDTGETVTDALAGLSNDVVNVINQVEDAQTSQATTSSRMAGRMMTMDDEDDFSPDFSFSTNDLYLQMLDVTNGTAYLSLNNATDSVYEIFSKTALTLTNWNIESELWPTNTNSMAFTIQTEGRTNLFVWAMDWTGVTHGGNTTPDWWFYYWFGMTNFSETNLDSLGNTIGYDYTNSLDPNVILFSLSFTNQFISTSTTYGGLTIDAGISSYVAVLLNDTNTGDAVWQPYSSTNVPVNFNYGNGTYTVGVGLKGCAPAAQQTWLWDSVTCFNPDAIPLILTVTNPVSSTVSVPMIQLQGYVSKSLTSLTYDVSNASEVITNQAGYWQAAYYDTNVLQFTTNSFQCHDIPLISGLNIITLHATDTSSNTVTTNFSYTLDYSGVTNGPALTLLWPTNEAEISIGELSSDGLEGGSDTFTVKAKVDDATATVGASIADAYGDTDTARGLVERDGTVWVNLPVEDVTNTITLSATNAAGYVSQSTSTVYESDAIVAVLPLADNELNQSLVSVTGLVSDAGDNITVNGMTAAVNSDGVWTADGVPVSPTGTAELAVRVRDDGGNAVTSGIFYQAQPAMVVPVAYTLLLRSSDWGYNSWCDGTGPEVFNNDTEHWVSGEGSDYQYASSWDGDCNDPVLTNSDTIDLSDYVNDLPAPWENINVSVTDPANGTTRLNIQTALAIEPSGQQAAGESALYLVEASALEFSGDPVDAIASVTDGYEGDVPLPPEWLQVNGQTLINSGITNEDGSVMGLTAVNAPAGVAVNAPLTITQFYSNHLASFNVKVYQLVSQCVATTPSDRTRTNLGVGEQVNLSFNPPLFTNYSSVTWSTTAGSLLYTNGTSTVFTAPSNATNVTITATIGSAPVNLYYKVYAPSVETSVISSTDSIPMGVEGAGMQLTITWGPTNVSFSHVQILEVPGPASNITGYFTNFDPSILAHYPNTNWVNISSINTTGDHAAITNAPAPWYPGGYDWNIPVQWRIVGSSITNNFPNDELQSFSITDTNGTTTVSKLGSSVTRTP